MKSVLLGFFAFVLTQQVVSQDSQIQVASKVISRYQGNCNMLYQSQDGISTCEGFIEFSKSKDRSTLEKISLQFKQCTGVLSGISDYIVLTQIQNTDQKFLFADNEQYSARFIVQSGGNYILDKLISKTGSNKLSFQFSYSSKPLETEEKPIAKIQTPAKKDSPVVYQEVKRPAQSPLYSNQYKVQEGDYIYKIARETGCSASTLMAINNIRESDYLYPGQSINLCDNSHAPSNISSSNKPSKSASSIDKQMTGIQKDYESLQKQIASYEKEIASLNTYGTELKKDYELLVREFNELNASYQNLITEYKETVESNKNLQAENERLKQLLKEKNIDPEKELTNTEKEKVDALQQQIQTVRSQISEMKQKIEETTPKVEENNSNKEVTSPATTDVSTNSEETLPSYELIKEDPKFIEFSQVISDRIQKDEKTSRLHVERFLSYKLEDNKVKEITSISTNELKNNKIDKKKKVSDYIQTLDIFALMNLQYPDFNTKKEYINTKLYVDIEKTSYMISVGKKDFKVKKSSRDLNTLKSNDPHFELIKEELKKEKVQDGDWNILIIDKQVNLEYEQQTNHYVPLHSFSKPQVIRYNK